MQLLNPAMLLALAAIPILVLIHALKPKPTPTDITNLFLWQEILKERSRNLTLKRLIRNLLLLLQIIIVALVSIALAKPVWFYRTPKTGDVILIIDTSASMKTRRTGGIRLDAAKQRAVALIEQSDDHQKILIVEAGNAPSLKAGFTKNKGRAKALVKQMSASDAPGSLEESVYLAVSFTDPSTEDHIYLITDGAGCDFSKIVEIHPNIIPVLVTGGETNVGITRFEFRQEFMRENHYEILLEIRNFSTRPLACPVRLSVDKTVIFNTDIHFEPFEKQSLIFPYSGLISGIAKAELRVDDDFTVDNTAFLSLNTTQDIWVLVVSKGNYFLEKLLESYPNVMVNIVREIVPSSWEEQTVRHDIVIVDRMDFPSTAKGNFLLIDSFSPSLPATVTGRLDFPEILDWDRESPLLARADISSLTIERASKLKVDETLEPVIETSQSGLMYTFENDGFRAVLLGFDITRSDLPLKVAFPVMVSNIFNWLNPHKLQFSSLHTKAGRPFDIYLNPDTQQVAVKPPRGRWEKFDVQTNPFRYTNTRKVGVYIVSENGKRKRFTVNLLNELESDITVPGPFESDESADKPGNQKPLTAAHAAWPVFMLLALGVLMLEWFVWLRTE